MKFEERVSKHPNRRILVKLDSQGNPTEQPIIVDILRDESIEGVEKQGTPITAERLNEGNWRTDKSLSFKKLTPGEQEPSTKIDETQIYTTSDGKSWLLAPGNTSTRVEIGAVTGTRVSISGKEEGTISFTSDPQAQLDSIREQATQKQEQMGITRNETIQLINNTADNLNNQINVTNNQVSELNIRLGNQIVDASNRINNHIAQTNGWNMRTDVHGNLIFERS